MKIVKKLFLMFGLITTPILLPMTGSLPGGAGDPMFQMPSPEEMQAIEEFLQTLSPEEIDQLAKLGEEIIKEAEAEGRPLFADMPIPTPTEKPKEKPAEAPKAPEEKVQDKAKQKTQKLIKSVVNSLIDIISILRQKAAVDEKYSSILIPINPNLDTFVYYLHVIRDSKHIKNLTDDEFSTLKNEITNLEKELGGLIENLTIPAVFAPDKLDKRERESRRRAIKKAEQIIQQCIGLLQEAFTTKAVLKEFEKLLKKYEPEAIKIKEEQTTKSKHAGGQINRLPVTNTGKIVQGPSYSTKTAHYTPVSRGSSVGTSIPSSYSNERNFGGSSMPMGGGSKAKGGNNKQAQKGKKSDGSTESESKGSGEAKPTADDEHKARLKTKEERESMTKNLKEANKMVMNKKTLINRFLDNYLNSTDKDPHFEKSVKESLDDINIELSKAQDNYNNCVKNAKKLPPRERRKALEECEKNTENYTRDITELYNKLQDLNEDNIIPDKYDQVDKEISGFEKIVVKLPGHKEPEAAQKNQQKKNNDQKKQADTNNTKQQGVQTSHLITNTPPQALSIPEMPEIPESEEQDEDLLTRSAQVTQTV